MATGCHQDNTPQFYNSLTKDNFVQGCIGGSTGTTLGLEQPVRLHVRRRHEHGPRVERGREGQPKKYSGYTGPNFKQLNSHVKSNPNKVPSELQDAWAKTAAPRATWDATTTSAAPTWRPDDDWFRGPS